MFKWFKKHFIPHEGNEHRPHILRPVNTRKIVTVVLLLEVITFLIPTFFHFNMTGGMAAVLPSVLSILTNNERKAQDLGALTVNPILNKAAEMKAKDMATHGYFAHTSPDGKTPWYWLGEVGYKYQYAGENLAVNFTDSKDVSLAWMASLTHKENIVKENYTEMGTGVAVGMYKGEETIFVAQIYANPLSSASVTEVKVLPKENEAPPSSVTTSPSTLTNVLGEETVVLVENIEDVKISPAEQPTFLEKAFASPRNTTNIILYIIFSIITFALLLYAIIKIKNYHLDLITNGLIVLSVVGMIFTVNYYLSHHNMIISQSLDYSNEASL